MNHRKKVVFKRTLDLEIELPSGTCRQTDGGIEINSPQEVVTKIILDLENEMVHMKLRSNGLWVIEHFVHIDFGSKHGAGFPALHSA